MFMSIDANWPVQTVGGLPVVLLPLSGTPDILVGTYGHTGIEFGGAWKRADGSNLGYDDPTLDLMNVPMAEDKPRWIVLYRQPIKDGGFAEAIDTTSERIIYDGRFHHTKESADGVVRDALRQAQTYGRSADRPDLHVACVTLHRPAHTKENT